MNKNNFNSAVWCYHLNTIDFLLLWFSVLRLILRVFCWKGSWNPVRPSGLAFRIPFSLDIFAQWVYSYNWDCPYIWDWSGWVGLDKRKLAFRLPFSRFSQIFRQTYVEESFLTCDHILRKGSQHSDFLGPKKIRHRVISENFILDRNYYGQELFRRNMVF